MMKPSHCLSQQTVLKVSEQTGSLYWQLVVNIQNLCWTKMAMLLGYLIVS
jgi:hypothetical protein